MNFSSNYLNEQIYGHEFYSSNKKNFNIMVSTTGSVKTKKKLPKKAKHFNKYSVK